MLRPEWKCIAGIHAGDDGKIAAVWLGREPHSDTVHVWDACIFTREVFVVVAQGLNGRGRWIPIAWEKQAKEIADALQEHGCRVLRDPVPSSQPAIEAASTNILERMRSQRFKVDKRLSEWREEYKTFIRDDQKVPTGSHPLMAATRNAMEMLNWAKGQRIRRGRKGTLAPRIAIA